MEICIPLISFICVTSIQKLCLGPSFFFSRSVWAFHTNIIVFIQAFLEYLKDKNPFDIQPNIHSHDFSVIPSTSAEALQCQKSRGASDSLYHLSVIILVLKIEI